MIPCEPAHEFGLEGASELLALKKFVVEVVHGLSTAKNDWLEALCPPCSPPNEE